jgi:hypothetical protein
MALVWKRRAFGGWVAVDGKDAYTITRYPSWAGPGTQNFRWAYLLRINNNSEAAVGRCVLSLAAAKRRAAEIASGSKGAK